METRISALAGPTKQSTASVPVTLQLGDIVQARVLEQSGSKLRLQIGANTLSARLAASQESIPKSGRFEVVQLEPALVLKIKDPTLPPAKTAIERLARDVLPAQRPLQTLLDKMSHLKQGLLPSSPSSPLAKSAGNQIAIAKSTMLSQVFSNIENRISELSLISSAAGLQTAIKNSGIFLESRLSRFGPSIIHSDLKAGLLMARENLRAVLAPQAPESAVASQKQAARTQAASGHQPVYDNDVLNDSLLKVIDAGIARIETLQLANHSIAANGQNTIYLEIPLRVGEQMDTIQLVIEQEQSTDEDNEQTLSSTIYLEFHIAEDEQLQAKIASHTELFSVALWSESARVQRQLHQNISRLEDTLASSLSAKPQISVQAFASKFLDPSKLFTNLLSEKA